jgi:Tol biopolymer transport system component
MTRTCLLFLLLLAVGGQSGQAQITVTKTEKLALSRSNAWSHPQFSPTGGAIYFTNLDGNGIWEYSLRTRSTRQLTSDPKAGLAFDVSADGKSLVYRRTILDNSGGTRKQDVVLMNIARRSSSLLTSGADVSSPSFVENAPVYSTKLKKESLPKTSGLGNVSVLGIDNMKIVLNLNGNRMSLDPLGNGSYVWPVLSPDKQQLVAYEVDRGAFICDLRGTVISRLGRRDAPSWTRSGRWIVYMEDKDDGHKLLSSDIFAVSPDGKSTIQLTSTSGVFELYPQCSPTENKIVCNTSDGGIMILEYEERQ